MSILDRLKAAAVLRGYRFERDGQVERMMRTDGSVAVTAWTNPDDYREWAARQVCQYCGAKFGERRRDANGVALDLWIDETTCGACYAERRR